MLSNRRRGREKIYGERSSFQVRLDPELHKRFKRVIFEQDESAVAVVAELIERYVIKKEKELAGE